MVGCPTWDFVVKARLLKNKNKNRAQRLDFYLMAVLFYDSNGKINAKKISNAPLDEIFRKNNLDQATP